MCLPLTRVALLSLKASATADKCVGMPGRVGIPVEVVQLECRMVTVHVCSAVRQQPLPPLPLWPQSATAKLRPGGHK